jgi:hypothetical protein
MELGPYIKERLPSVIRGITQMVASNMGKTPAAVDPTPQFMEKRLAILSKYQEDLKDLEDAPAKIMASPTATVECPYCHMEELAGIVRNHLLFVAQECRDDDLAPATGGMIPKAKSTTEEFIQRAEGLDAPNHIKLVTQLAVMKAQELLPMLEWVHNCKEAKEAATIADEMWHRAAKATQMYYAETPDSPYR